MKNTLLTETILHQFSDSKLIPVVSPTSAKQAVIFAGILAEYGIHCIEITLRTDAALDAIEVVKQTYPDLLIAAGTVLSQEQALQASNAGAQLLFSPGLNMDVARYCQQQGITHIPGINNPSQVEQALSLGLDTLKFFPAEASGGTAMLNALAAVYPVKFIPTGGISQANIISYLELDSVIACGGSWLSPVSMMQTGQWSEIRALVQSANEVLSAAN